MDILMKLIIVNLIFFLMFLGSCSPTVKVSAPDKPIEINLNVNIEHNVKIKVDRELDELMKKQKDIF